MPNPIDDKARYNRTGMYVKHTYGNGGEEFFAVHRSRYDDPSGIALDVFGTEAEADAFLEGQYQADQDGPQYP